MITALSSAVYILIDIIGTYIMACYLRLFNRRLIKNVKVELAGYIVWHISSYLVSMLDMEPFMLIIFNVFMAFCMTFSYGSPLSVKFFSVAITMIISLFTEFLSVLLVGSSFNAIADGYVSLCSKVIQIGVWIVLSIIWDSGIKSKRSYIQWYLPIMFSIMMLLSYVLLQFTDLDAYYILLSFFLMITLMASLIFIYKLDQERLRSQEMLSVQKAESYKRQYRQLHDSYDDFNSMRHNLAKNFLVLKKMINDGRSRESIVDKMNEILLETLGNEHLLIETYNIEIDSIINAKIKEAEEKGLMINHKILIPEQMDIDKELYFMIVNNIFDVTMEETGRTEQKKLNFVVRYDTEYLYSYWIHPYEKTDANGKKFLKRNRNFIKEIEAAVKSHNGWIQCIIDDDKVIWDVSIYAGEL